MTVKNFFAKSIVSFVAMLGIFFVPLSHALAADGSGTNTVSPTSVMISSTGNNLSFTMTAAETMDSGGFNITVPSGWSTPNSTPATAGYTTVTSASGLVATVLNTLDSISGWAANQHMSLSADTGDKQEGTGSLSNAITANASANEQWYFNYGGATSWGTAANGTNGQRVGMWIKSSVNTASGDLSWQDDNSASLASPEDTLAIAALTANTWKYTSVTLSAARTTQLSYGLRYTTDLGAATVKLDSVSVLFDAADVTTNWTGDTNITVGAVGSGQEGTNSIRCTYAGTAGTGANGECYRTSSALTILPGNKVSFWVRSSVALNAGDFAWVDDNSASLASVLDTVSLPALSANTWTYVTLSIPNLGVNSIRSYGLRQVNDKGALTIDIDAMGSIIDYSDATTGWTAPTSALQTLSLDGSVLHEGTGSLKNVLTAGATAGDSWYQTLGATQNWSGYTTVGFWIRSTVAANAGDLQFVYDDANDVSSPIGSINIGALSANTWTYQKLTLTGTRTSVNSFGIKYVTNIGATTINVDDFLVGPGVPTFPGGGVINTRILGLTTPQTMVVSYGNATAPGTTGNSTFTTQTRVSDAGTLTNIASSPVVSVDKVTTTTALGTSLTPQTYGTSVTFTATVTPASGGPATGTVTFKDGVTTIGTGTLSSGVATYATSTLSVAGSPHSITAEYGGDTTFSGSTSNAVAQTMTAKALTVTGMTATTKEYDGGVTATLTGGSLVGVVSGDTVSIDTRTGTFATKTVGTGKAVNVTSVTLNGSSAGNYTVTNPTDVTGTITAKALTVTGMTATTKEYDGGVTATLTGGSLVGIISPDVVSIDTRVGTFATKTVGTGKTVNVSSVTLTGADQVNYTVTAPTDVTGTITAKALTVTGMLATTKEYDGGITATLTGGSLVGVINPDVVSINTRVGTFATKTVGTGKTVNVSSVTLTGADQANYTVTAPTDVTGTITAKELTVTGMLTTTKEYDGGVTATLTGGTLVGVINPDIVSISSREGTFVDKNIGTDKTVNVTSVVLGGTDASNYTVALPAGVMGTITKKTLTVTGLTADNKEYDRETTATLTGGSLSGVIVPDVVSIGTSVGSFATKTVANGKTVTVDSITLSGTDKDNYTVTLPTGLTANITAKALTVTGMLATTKEYDGGDTVTLTSGSLVGVISPDSVSIASRSGSFADKTVGTGKAITVTSVTLTGVDSNNYTVTNPTDIVGDITAKTITVTGVTADDKVYDGDDTAVVNTTGASLVGVISGDIVTINSSAATGTFDSASVGLGKSVTITGLALSGTDGSNYLLTQPTGITASIRNPLPVTTSINPASKETEEAGFSLTVNGSGFLTSSVVKFNGSSRTTHFVSSAQITADIPSTDLLVATSSALVTVTNPAPGGGTSNAQIFVVAHSATQFVIIPPSLGSVDASSTVTIQAQKANGAIDTTYQEDVTLNTSGSAIGGGLVDIVNGEGTLSLSDHSAETVHLTLTDSQNTHLSVSSTQDLVFAPGAVTDFSLNSPGNMNARTRLGFQITRKDQYSNAVLAGMQTAYLYSNSTSTDKKFYDDSLTDHVITSIDFSDGSALANFWYYDDMPGTYTLTASDHTPTADLDVGINDATRDVTVIPVAVKFVILTASSTSVDSSLTVTVQAQKENGDVDTSFQEDVTLNADGSVTGDGLVDIVNGVGTKNLSDIIAETVHLTLSDSEGAGLNVDSSAVVNWLGGATTQFSLTSPTTLSAGSRVAYTVSRKDQHGNLTSQGDITAYLYSSSASANKKFYSTETGEIPTGSITILAGQQTANFWYYDEAPGTVTITASDGTPLANGPAGISDALVIISVTPGPVSSFTLNNAGDMTAKTRLGYTVTRKDQFGNLVTSGNTTAYLYTTAGALGVDNREFYDLATLGNPISNVSISDGSSLAHFWYYEEVAGLYTVTASDSISGPDILGITDGTASVNVSPAPIVATRFVIIPPSSGTVDSPITITIQAQDDAGSLDTTATSSVMLLTSGSATGAGLVTLSGGVGTIQISNHNAETVHLSLSDVQHTGLNVSSTADAVFSTGEAKQLFLDNPGDIAAGLRLGFTVTRKDQFGNLITSGITNVTLDSSSVGVNKRFYDAVSGGSVIPSVNILDGQSTARFWYYDELAGSATVTVSGAVSGMTGANRTFAVTPSSIAKFILDNPGNMTAGTRLEYTLTRKDTFDNLVTSGIVSAYLYSSAATTSSKFYDVATGGASSNIVSFVDGAATTNFWYYEEAPGTWVITASDGTPTANGTDGLQDAADSVTVTLATITATHFTIQPVSNGTINIPTTVTIRAEDANGNVDANYNHNVTLVTSGSATGGGVVTMINGVGTMTIRDTVAETITLSLVDSQSTGLGVSSTQTLTFGAVYVPPTIVNIAGVTAALPAVSGVRFIGKAFPGASLNVIAIGGEDSLQTKKGVATSNGNFVLSFTGLTGGARSYGIVGTDKNNNTTQVKIFDANQANALLQLDINGILLSPTLGLARTAVTKGDVLGITGAGAPGYKVEVQVDNQPTGVTATVDSKGIYKALVPTSTLGFGSHTVRTRQTSPAGLKSDYSPQEVFSVVNIFTPNMDFSGDGIIGVQDYSIFVSRWRSSDAKLRAKDDLNGDGKVDIQDLSIFSKTLKKI